MLYNIVVVSGQQEPLSPKDPKFALFLVKVMTLLVAKGEQATS
jgi:hypothetical protein